MKSVNDAFFTVAKYIFGMQKTFIDYAWGFGRAIFGIALGMAIINYAINGTGLKDSLIKIGKGLAFFFIFIHIYPGLLNAITGWTYNAAMKAIFTGNNGLQTKVDKTSADIAAKVTDQLAGAAEEKKKTFALFATTSPKVSPDKSPDLYMGSWFDSVNANGEKYTVVAPGAMMQAMLLVAGECMRSGDEAPKEGIFPDIGAFLKGFVCALFVIATGAFGVLEYVIAYLEFALVASVGIVVLPFCIWDGTKFISEKFIGALTGFTMKLLFCNVCILIMIYGYVSLAKGYTEYPFTGRADEIIVVVFSSLLYFYICRQGPALAQSLLTGSPTLNAAGAIASSAAAIGGAAAVAGFGMNRLANTGTGLAKIAGAGIAAGKAAKSEGGSIAGVLGAGLAGAASQSGQNAINMVSNIGGSLSRSLMSRDPTQKLFNPGGNYGSSANVASLLNKKNADGSRQSIGQHLGDAFREGKSTGNHLMGVAQPAPAAAKADSPAETNAPGGGPGTSPEAGSENTGSQRGEKGEKGEKGDPGIIPNLASFPAPAAA